MSNTDRYPIEGDTREPNCADRHKRNADECFGPVDLYYVGYPTQTVTEWLCKEHGHNCTRVPK